MKLHYKEDSKTPLIQSYQTGVICIQDQEYTHSLLCQGSLIHAWNLHSFNDLSEATFQDLSHHNIELLIVGTGDKLRFFHPKLYASLINKQIGVEIMDTAAACRTYNVLLAEGRNVMAALLIERP